MQIPTHLTIDRWLLVISGTMAWVGVPLLTYIAARWAMRQAASLVWKTLSGLSVFASGAAIFVWMHWFHNPLPSDELLLRHFREHRAELEQLVQGYRNYRRPDLPGNHYYEKSKEVKELMKKVDVWHVIGAQAEAGLWYPDHYSPETITKVKNYFGWGRSIHERLTSAEAIAILKREMPEVFESVAPMRDVLEVAKVTQVISLDLGPNGHIMQPHRLGYPGTEIYKGYYYFPQPPRIENGHILIHDFHKPDGLGGGQRIFESLDDYPPDWKKGECVLKPMDAQWFIAMCRTY